jgi:ferritin
LPKPEETFGSIKDVFKNLLEHEVNVTNKINNVVHICLEEKDYTTHNFMQWYVSEQIEEEALARTVMDRLNLVAEDASGMYMFDRDIMGMRNTASNKA